MRALLALVLSLSVLAAAVPLRAGHRRHTAAGAQSAASRSHHHHKHTSAARRVRTAPATVAQPGVTEPAVAHEDFPPPAFGPAGVGLHRYFASAALRPG
ncbi:hypothetical protein ACQP2X_15745 [Actinoplanes sp. CA-131856]